MLRPLPAFATLAVWSLSACGPQPAATPAAAELRFSVLPDFNKDTLAEASRQLAAVLGRKLAVPVRYEAANDYAHAVNMLAANKVDFVWLGGKTTCDAIDAGAGTVHVLATRDIDLHFKTYFVANREAVAAGKVKPMQDLRELAAVAKDLTFTFGDKNSTSGHLMPRHFLVLAGIDPDRAFRGACGYQAAGGHSATLKAVASGAADLGALNFAYYDAAKAEDKAAAPIVYTTPEYVDYAWVAHDRIGADLAARLRGAFTGLDAAVAEEKAILDAWKCRKFEPAQDSQWDSIRKVRDSLPKGFLR
ncbi:MAG: putative selenate ABC transporter substrate-binding protein [Planctomycetes bacterium]|nr:putative selenate ABC transporter substrate-binding protein [Planctomycetota bacterium]